MYPSISGIEKEKIMLNVFNIDIPIEKVVHAEEEMLRQLEELLEMNGIVIYDVEQEDVDTLMSKKGVECQKGPTFMKLASLHENLTLQENEAILLHCETYAAFLDRPVQKCEDDMMVRPLDRVMEADKFAANTYGNEVLHSALIKMAKNIINEMKKANGMIGRSFDGEEKFQQFVNTTYNVTRFAALK